MCDNVVTSTGYYPQPGRETACLNFAIDFFNRGSTRPMRAGPLRVDKATIEVNISHPFADVRRVPFVHIVVAYLSKCLYGHRENAYFVHL